MAYSEPRHTYESICSYAPTGLCLEYIQAQRWIESALLIWSILTSLTSKSSIHHLVLGPCEPDEEGAQFNMLYAVEHELGFRT